MRLILVFCSTVFVLISTPVYASSDVALYNNGNLAYRNGDYEKALELYGQIKTVNPDVYYNKACAAYKSGLLGKAMVNFYRAERIMPGDKDTRENIRFLKSVKTDRERVEEPSIFGELFRFFTVLLNMKMMTISFLFSYTTGAILAIYIILASKAERKKRMPHLYAIGVATICFGFLAAVQIYQFERDGGAVAISPKVNAFAAPSEDSALVFTFHEATKVTIEKVEGDYAFVYVSSGLSGWVKRGALERI